MREIADKLDYRKLKIFALQTLSKELGDKPPSWRKMLAKTFDEGLLPKYTKNIFPSNKGNKI